MNEGQLTSNLVACASLNVDEGSARASLSSMLYRYVYAALSADCAVSEFACVVASQVVGGYRYERAKAREKRNSRGR